MNQSYPCSLANGLLCATLLSLGYPAASQAEMTLHADFDSASLNVPQCEIIGQTITLVPRATFPVGWRANKYLPLSFRLTGARGLTPRFEVNAPPLEISAYLGGAGFQAEHQFLYSYDRENWIPFDNHQVDRANHPPDIAIPDQRYQFSNSSPFDADTVYVSSQLPYPVSRVRSLVDSIASHRHVSPTRGADSDFIIGHGAGGVDELGNLVPPQEILAFRITDLTIPAFAKKKIVLACGQHGGVTHLSHVLEGMVRFLVSDDPRAAVLRDRTTFYVYPLLSPDSRYGGYWRSGPEHPDIDYNRVWSDPSGFTDLTIARDSMVADTGGDIDAFFCFYDVWGLHEDLGTTNSASTYLEEIKAIWASRLEVEVYTVDPTGPVPPYLEEWATHPEGLNAESAFTPSIAPSFDLGRYQAFGEALAVALFNDLPDQSPIPSDPEITSISVDRTHQSVTINWTPVSGLAYRIESSPDLGSEPWQVTQWEARGQSTATISYASTGLPPRMMYRVLGFDAERGR